VFFLILIMCIFGCSAGNGEKGTVNSVPSGPIKQGIVQSEIVPEEALADDEQGLEQTTTGAVVKGADDATETNDRTLNENRLELSMAVSKNFGGNRLSAGKMEGSPGNSLMDVLKAHLDIETAYGGSFINSVNGIASERGSFTNPGTDWFLYINGICCDTGAGDYVISAGDSVWLDYHGWQMGPSNAAVVGLYPEPFLHGYRGKQLPVYILADEENRDLADKLSSSLVSRGVQNVSVAEMSNELLANRKGPTIVLGVWSKIQQFPYLSSLNDAYRKNGMGIHFTSDGVELLDYSGKKADILNAGTGVIAASGEGLGDASPLWLISGTDPEGFRHAANILVNYSGELAYYYGAAVNEGQLIRLPRTN